MTPPADQPQRDRFISELTRNFSVVAAAGSGKTRAITDRILAMTKSSQAPELLASLVVVTYTNRAADEMQQRVRNALLDSKAPIGIHAALGRAYFGTIHSFCLKLLSEYGHHLGLPSRLELVQDDEALWREFVQQHPSLARCLNAEQRKSLLRLTSAHGLLELGRTLSPEFIATGCGDFPAIAFDEIYNCSADARSAAKVKECQDRLRAWEEAWHRDHPFLTLPKITSQAKSFAAAWSNGLRPIREWLRDASMAVGAEVAAAYRCFRIARGVVTYDDQIALARALLCHPEAGPAIRKKGFRVILDEAQDTDPAQFSVLLELTRPPEESTDWLNDDGAGPRPGHFCMVGDFQQSIYGQRADLAHYRSVHDKLVRSGAADALEFSVTFRLDEDLVSFINDCFPSILTGGNGQVSFLPLNSRPAALPGQALRLPIPKAEEAKEWNLARKMRHEAEHLAEWLKRVGPRALRAQSWGEVAILCPRTRWLPPLLTALRQHGLDGQIQSEREIRGDSAAYAWLAGLLVALSEPDNSYEIVGVLREIYGISDHELADFSQGYGDRFHLNIRAPGKVGEILRQLCELRERVLQLPLYTAVSEIVAAVDLPARLASLPADAYPEWRLELNALLARAASEEPEGASLADFASLLRSEFSLTREVRRKKSDVIQLISTHKAKGLEWQAVIIPGLGRQISAGTANYPRVTRDCRTGEILIALEPDDNEGEIKAAFELKQRQEMERLLYVALTRAKHTLVLVDDLELFAKAKGGIADSSLGSFLQCAKGGANAGTFGELAEDPTPCADTFTYHQSPKARTTETSQVPPPPFTEKTSDAAVRRATHFVKRNPSALVAHDEDDPLAQRFLPADAETLALYGTWWHGLMETLDWGQPTTAWEETFQKLLPRSPDAKRSLHEWTNFIARSGPESNLILEVAAPGLIRQVEMPFLWKMSESECLEGIMDMVVYDPSRAEWLVLDWKTNPLQESELPSLRKHYQPQLAAYWRALSDMTGQPVRAALYSTACATWLPYQTEELRSTWQQISGNPAAIAEALSEE